MTALILGYLVIGILTALWFFVRGYRVIDSTAANAAWYTRLMWCPGALLLWPVILLKTFRVRRGADG